MTSRLHLLDVSLRHRLTLSFGLSNVANTRRLEFSQTVAAGPRRRKAIVRSKVVAGVLAASCFAFASGVWAQPAFPAPPPESRRVVETNYVGWANSYCLSNGKAEVVVVPAIGRVMRFGFPGEEGPLWENPALRGKPADATSTEWVNFGGDKTWPAPQADWPKVSQRSWPPPVAFDSMPVRAEVAGQAIVLNSATDPHYGIRTRRRIELHPSKPVMRITTTYEKVSGDPTRVAVWIITQLREPVKACVGLPAASRNAGGYVKLYDSLPPDLSVQGGLVSLTRSEKLGTKIGTDASSLLWVGEKTMLLIQSPRIPEVEYPDSGSSAEIWTNPDPFRYVELEMLGPLQTMRVGDRLAQTNLYTLLPRTSSDAVADARQALNLTP